MHHPVIMVFLLFLLRVEAAVGNEQPAVTAIDLANLRDIGGHGRGAINVSPDGRWVVFQLQTPRISEGDYDLSWVALSTQGGKAFHVADGEDVLLNPTLQAWTNGNRPEIRAKWSPDSRSFAFLARQNGQTQIWHSRPDQEGRVQLTHNAADVIDFAWSPDGSKLYFETGLVRNQIQTHYREEGVRGFLFDNRFAPMIGSARPFLRDCSVENDRGRSVSFDRVCQPAIWIFDFEFQEERLATNEELRAYNQLSRGSKMPELLNGRALNHLAKAGRRSQYAWLENTDPETYQSSYAPLIVHALIDGEIRMCTERKCRAHDIRGHQGLWWSQNEREVIFLRRDGASYSQSGLYAWAPSSGDFRRILQTDDWLSDCAPARDRLICLFEGWTQPRKIVSVSLNDGAVMTLYEPNPEFANHRFSKIEKLEWKDKYGNATHGHLVYPIDYDPKRKYPLVIVTYKSRGFLRGGVGDEYPIHPLAAEGFFVLSHEMPFDLELIAKARADNSFVLYEDLYLRKSVLSSQEHIIYKLVNAGLVDESGVAITGLSEGTSQVSYALIHSNINFAAAIASSPDPSDTVYYLTNESLQKYYKESMNGLSDKLESRIHSLSTGLNADHVDTPLLINISDWELLMAVENVVRLKDANKPVEMYVFPGEYHIKWRPDHRLAIYRRNIQWLKFWLLGEEVDDPLDPDQYTRWREMRDDQCTRLEGQEDAPWYCP